MPNEPTGWVIALKMAMEYGVLVFLLVGGAIGIYRFARSIGERWLLHDERRTVAAEKTSAAVGEMTQHTHATMRQTEEITRGIMSLAAVVGTHTNAGKAVIEALKSSMPPEHADAHRHLERARDHLA